MPAEPFKIFVVEDNEWYNKLLVHNLSLNPDYVVKSFLNARECIDNLHENPNVITLDYRLPDMTGLQTLQEIKSRNPEIQVILISEQEDIEVVVDLLKQGAYDYIIKSDDIRERLLNTVSNIRKGIGLRNELNQLKKEVQSKYDFQKSIIGESPAIKKVFDRIEKALPTNIPVTITGETGTGKELAAKAIHYNSKRKDKAFVAVNLAAIPSELIESELFGHEKGAFTGASFRRIGKFEEANGGTLFLDEIAEMDISFQVKLLRALQEKEIIRVGSNQPIKTDCRIIVATNRNLQTDVKENKFRSDLYYRLLGLPIEMPPLRDRGSDILILAQYFLKQFCKENDLVLKSLSPEARNKLMNYSYPGNVRELKSIIDLSATLSAGDQIHPDDISFTNGDPTPDLIGDEMTLRDYEYRLIDIYMQKYDQNAKKVAQKLDIGVSTIYRMLKELKK